MNDRGAGNGTGTQHNHQEWHRIGTSDIRHQTLCHCATDKDLWVWGCVADHPRPLTSHNGNKINLQPATCAALIDYRSPSISP